MSSSMGHESSGGADEEEASSGLQRVVWFRQMLHRWQSSSSSRSATASERRSSASDDGDGANPAAATIDRNNDDNDATPPAADNAASSSSSRDPPLPPASHSAADEDDDRQRRLPRVLVVEERIRRGDAAACESPMTPDAAAPADVPRGCCPVYVGAERRRFVVPTAYLGMPVFRRLLEKAEEEFEFHYHGGAVTIPCDTEAFKYILVVMDRHRQGLVDDEGNDKHGEQDASSSSQAR
ncbi:uncharacterized protein [Miscanthus floridulus]|uniref:uncharacterized protein n=1 Tax=Miscanthus floridulus TaxID=154761 RepID=UPI003457C150